MSLKLTSQNKQSEFNNKLAKYNKYNNYYSIQNMDKNSYQYQVLNYVFMDMVINEYNYHKKKTLKELKSELDNYNKREFKEAGFKLNCKDDIIRWIYNISYNLNMENKNHYLRPCELHRYIYELNMSSDEELKENFYDYYVVNTYKRYINLMRDLKPFLRDIKDNTIICKNEEIFTIILLARNNKFTINYYAMKNIISYL